MNNICSNNFLRSINKRDVIPNVYNILKIGVPSLSTGRIYTMDSVFKILSSFNEKTDVKGIIDLDYSSSTCDFENLDNYSHKVNDMWIDGDILKAKIVVLDNEFGKILQQLLDVDFIHFGTSCTGNVNDDNTIQIGEFLSLVATNKDLCGYTF